MTTPEGPELVERARVLLAVEWGESEQFATIRKRILDGSCDIHSDGMSLASSIALRAIAKALSQSDRSAVLEEAAEVAERDADWSAFGRGNIEQWQGGPDGARDYRLGIAAGRAIAAAIRKLKERPDV